MKSLNVKKQTIINSLETVGVVIVALLAIGSIVHGHHEETASNNTKVNLAYDARMDKGDYKIKNKMVQKKLFSHSLTSKDPIIRSIAVNSYDNSEVNNASSKFFKIYYTWGDHQDYVNRSSELKNVATSNLLKDKQFFNSDKDSSGDSEIEAEGLHSSFNSLNTFIVNSDSTNLDVIADVQYEAWSTDNEQNSSSSHPEGEKWFEMTYNTKSHKFTNMKPLVLDKHSGNSSTDE